MRGLFDALRPEKSLDSMPVRQTFEAYVKWADFYSLLRGSTLDRERQCPDRFPLSYTMLTQRSGGFERQTRNTRIYQKGIV